MTVTITSLSWREGGDEDCPYLMVNATLKVAHNDDPNDWDGNFVYNIFKAASEDFHRVIDIGSPEEYNRRFQEEVLDRLVENSTEKCWVIEDRPLKSVWTHADPYLVYIEKFDTFHFRDWVADCLVVRSILVELEHYRMHGELPSKYRTIDGQIILNHLHTLNRYWD